MNYMYFRTDVHITYMYIQGVCARVYVCVDKINSSMKFGGRKKITILSDYYVHENKIITHNEDISAGSNVSHPPVYVYCILFYLVIYVQFIPIDVSRKLTSRSYNL